MKQETLNTAVRLGQLLALLTPLGTASKSFNKRLSRVRSSLHELVILAAASSDADTAPGRRSAARMTEMHDALLASMLQFLDLKELLRRTKTEKSVFPTFVAKKGDRTGRLGRNDADSVLFEDVLAVPQRAEPEVSVAQLQRAKLVRAFTSSVRNSNWLQTLLRLELGLPLATEAASWLEQTHSSRQGRLALETNLLLLCPTTVAAAPAKGKRARKVVVKAEGLYTVQVAFSVETLLAQPDIAALAAVSLPKGGSPEGHELARLLTAASKPVVLTGDTTAEAAAQEVLNALVAALTERKKAVEAEAEKARAATEDANKVKAVAALKQLSPELLRVLKGNPDLLKSA